MSMSQLALIANNRQPHEVQAGVRYKTLDAAVAEFTALMDEVLGLRERAASCSCQQEPGFQINTRRNAGMLDAQFTLARLKRMAAEDGRAVL